MAETDRPHKPVVRLTRVDHLRGLAACGVMTYHIVGWAYGGFAADHPLKRVGLFAVPVFYMLSGLSLFHAYERSLRSTVRSVRSFLIRRVFRIYPLLIATALATYAIWPHMHDMGTLWLTVTGAFGFVAWDRHTGVGLWSIGNELVFYVLFPLVLASLRPRIGRWAIAIAAALLIAYAAFGTLDPAVPLDDQWHDYVSPWHQLPYFLLGMLVGAVAGRVPSVAPLLVRSAGVACIAMIMLIPGSGDAIVLVTGANRLIFTLLCAALCAAARLDTTPLPRWLDAPLSRAGEASYAIYMTHPIVNWVVAAAAGFVSLHVFLIPLPVKVGMTLLCTVVIAWFIHRYFEQFFIAMGKRISR